MGINETRFIERLQFFDGQRLDATDLQDLEAFNREMRWLHNQSLHQPGIGNGFAVSGQKGGRQVTIRPGYAIDGLGREIVLTETHLEAVPAVAGEDNGDPVSYYVTVSYPDDTDLKEAETRQGICLAGGVVRLREEPEFCWVRLQKDDQGNLQPKNPKLQSDLQDGLKIVLARAEVLNCQLYQDLSIAERRRARPACQPHIAGGLAAPTPWEAVEIVGPESDELAMKALYAASTLSFFPYGLKAAIDTSQAGFVTTPAYTAQIAGPRIKEIGKGVRFIIDGLVNISNPQPTGFNVEVMLMWQNLGFRDMALQPAAEAHLAFAIDRKALIEEFLGLFADWHIAWMGVEG